MIGTKNIQPSVLLGIQCVSTMDFVWRARRPHYHDARVKYLTCVMSDRMFDLGCRGTGGIPCAAQQGLDGGLRGTHKAVVRDALQHSVLGWGDFGFLREWT